MSRTELPSTACGRRLKRWRLHRGLSQLELGLRARVSQRHVSFIETGRSRPRHDIVLRLADALEIPLRERNAILESVGLAPRYPVVAISSAAIAPFREAVRRMITTHEPYPAYVINRWWEVVDANSAGGRLFPEIGSGAVNVVDAVFTPGGIRELVDNFPAPGWSFLVRLRREVEGIGRRRAARRAARTGRKAHDERSTTRDSIESRFRRLSEPSRRRSDDSNHFDDRALRHRAGSHARRAAGRDDLPGRRRCRCILSRQRLIAEGFPIQRARRREFCLRQSGVRKGLARLTLRSSRQPRRWDHRADDGLGIRTEPGNSCCGYCGPRMSARL